MNVTVETREIKCRRCAGSGQVNMSHAVFAHTCFNCGGSGVVTQERRPLYRAEIVTRADGSKYTEFSETGRFVWGQR